MSRNKKEKIPDDFMPGDDVCHQCVGIYIFTEMQKKNGIPPKCIGVKKILSQKMPKEDLLRVDEQTKCTKDKLSVCFGISTWNTRIERLGHGPVTVYGFVLGQNKFEYRLKKFFGHVENGFPVLTNNLINSKVLSTVATNLPDTVNRVGNGLSKILTTAFSGGQGR